MFVISLCVLNFCGNECAEDRLPPKGVFKNKLEWWDKWQNTVLHAAESENIKDIANSILEISLQMKKNITTTWWLSNVSLQQLCSVSSFA
jgi:hypothetical protein